MKFIHAADLHIDSPMRGLSRYEGAPENELRHASREAFRNLVATALDEQVDLVILAGDVFDGDWPDFNTGLFFMQQLHNLSSNGIKVVVLAGNHDAESKLTKQLSYPEGTFKLGHKSAESILPELLGLEVAVHGQSYANRDVSENLAANYPAPIPGVLNIGVLHTALTGRPDHASYAPCSIDDLRSKGYDYWALGHIHQREVVSQNPWIVFPGNLQGRSIRETGPKGFTLVTTSDGQILDVAHRDADTARWFNCEVDVTSANSEQDLLDLIRQRLVEILVEADGRLAAVRVVVTGQSDLHHDLMRHRETLVNEVRLLAHPLGEVWIEKVKFTTKGTVDRAEILGRHEALGDLFESIDTLRSNPDLLSERFRETFARLRTKLPREALDDVIDPTDQTVLGLALDAAESHILEVIGAEPET
ncbi:MAG TPA: DNA repair exonuclease [Microthrixaceae bacterium]|nr:DNA repair exonuclease [Microthrixaceae bacterium]